MRDFIGQNDFTWFIGVVEDRDDPLQLGRVRVRCYGWHTEDKGQIPTKALPWAVQLQGITSPALNGMGQSPTGLVEGSWIVGFFLDSEKAQEPCILGSIASAPSEYGDPKKGFFDPRIRDEDDDLHPHSKYPRYINETDVNRLARHNTTDTETKEEIHKTVPIFNIIKDNGVTLKVPVANSANTWSEPRTDDLTESGSTRYNTKYPKNHVYESESGHTVEFDDTENAERINEHHKSGTFYEIDADGNKVTRIVGNNYEIVAKNNNVNIKGDVNLTIDSNCNTYIKKDWNIQVDGNVNEVIKGNKTTQITGNLDIDAERIDLN